MSFLKNLFGSNEDLVMDEDLKDDPDRPLPIHVTDDDFDAVVLQSEKLTVVDLWAEWCGPCHMLAPTIEDLAEEYDGRVIVAKLDIDHNPKTPSGYGVMGIPTVLFIKDGQEVDRIVGVEGYASYANRIEKYI